MKKQGDRPIQKHLYLDVLLNLAALAGATYMIYMTNQYMSFGGFFSLFLLLILVPYFLVTIISLVLLLLHIKKNTRRLDMVAFVLQIAAPIPWLLLLGAFHSGGSWFEMILILQIIAGIMSFLLRTPGGEGK